MNPLADATVDHRCELRNSFTFLFRLANNENDRPREALNGSVVNTSPRIQGGARQTYDIRSNVRRGQKKRVQSA
jgi:hypothetical protein